MRKRLIFCGSGSTLMKKLEAAVNSEAKVLKRSWKRKQFFQNQALLDFQTLELATTVGEKCNNNKNNIESTTRTWYGMKRKFWYGIWKMPESNGRFQEWMEEFLLYFHTNSILDFVHCTVFTEKYIQMSGGDK